MNRSLKSLIAFACFVVLVSAIAAPALGNAIFAATGVRLRSLPVDRAALVQNSDALKRVVAGRRGGGELDPRATA